MQKALLRRKLCCAEVEGVVGSPGLQLYFSCAGPESRVVVSSEPDCGDLCRPPPAPRHQSLSPIAMSFLYITYVTCLLSFPFASPVADITNQSQYTFSRSPWPRILVNIKQSQPVTRRWPSKRNLMLDSKKRVETPEWQNSLRLDKSKIAFELRLPAPPHPWAKSWVNRFSVDKPQARVRNPSCHVVLRFPCFSRWSGSLGPPEAGFRPFPEGSLCSESGASFPRSRKGHFSTEPSHSFRV